MIAYGISSRLHPQVTQKPAPETAAPNLVRVLAASRAIARGETLSAGDIGVMTVSGSLPPGALTSPAQAVGRVAASDIAAQQLILAPLLAADAAGAGLAMLVKPGLRAISLDSNDEIAVSNFIRPGDRVDVAVVLKSDNLNSTAAEARTLLQDVEVLAVGSSIAATATAAAPNPATAARTVTLALTPDQVSRFVLARSMGRFYLTLRNPGDREATPANGVRAASLGGAAPGASQPRPRSRTAPHQIEVVVGGERGLIYAGAPTP